MFAVFETGGKQYKVSEGDIIFVEKLDVAEGETSWINYYATGLHSMPAWLLWSIRLGLLAVALVHIVLTLVLKYENYNARTHYQKENTQA